MYYAVYDSLGANEHKLYPEPAGGGVFDRAEIGRDGAGRVVQSPEAVITWTWGNTIEDALPYASLVAIMDRITTSGDLVVRTTDDTHTFGLWKGKTLPVPGHSSDGYHAFGITIVIDMATPFVP